MATLSKSSRSTTITLASASAGPFDLNFRLFDSDGIRIYVNNIEYPDTAWSLATNFNDGFDDNATVTFGSPQSSGSVIIIDSDLTPHRADDFNSGPNLVSLMNIELGRLWAGMADIRRDADRSVKMFDDLAPVVISDGHTFLKTSSGISEGPSSEEIALASENAAIAIASASSAQQAAENANPTEYIPNREAGVKTYHLGAVPTGTILMNAKGYEDIPTFEGLSNFREWAFGVGTAGGIIHILDGVSVGTPDPGANLIVEDDGGIAGMQLISTGSAVIYFGAQGWLAYDIATDSLFFKTAGTDHLKLTSDGLLQFLTRKLVSELPAAAPANEGARSFVTDATSTTFAEVVAGGGANKIPVYSDGTNWRIG